MVSETTWHMESGFLMRKSEKKGPYFLGPLLPILRVTFLESSCNFWQFGLKKLMVFFFATKSSLLPILRLTFLESSCNFWQFGFKKMMGIFFDLMGLQDPCDNKHGGLDIWGQAWVVIGKYWEVARPEWQGFAEFPLGWITFFHNGQHNGNIQPKILDIFCVQLWKNAIRGSTAQMKYFNS